ncbi:hypothetical protein ABZS78_39930, partial [Streptomyces decoyicus]
LRGVLASLGRDNGHLVIAGAGWIGLEVVDAILGQLDPADEVWVTVCSSSPWATRHRTGFLPSSPARDPRRYERFVSDLVTRCRGRVDYWQCNNEPSNTGLLWAGTAADYVEQLTAFHRCVRGADPDATVVLGGCGATPSTCSPSISTVTRTTSPTRWSPSAA